MSKERDAARAAQAYLDKGLNLCSNGVKVPENYTEENIFIAQALLAVMPIVRAAQRIKAVGDVNEFINGLLRENHAREAYKALITALEELEWS